MIYVRCDKCRKAFKVKEVLIGKDVACPYCRQPITVPAESAEEFNLKPLLTKVLSLVGIMLALTAVKAIFWFMRQ
ncbi:MAG: hypothetical protein K8T25_22075 [Planctomycetia bacterium]|nr:hypothetical protein [Planctomycetia bacterium]